jgi:hypothetical protein
MKPRKFDRFGIRHGSLTVLVTALELGSLATPVPANAAPSPAAKGPKASAQGASTPKTGDASAEDGDDSPKPSRVAATTDPPTSVIKEGPPPKLPKASDEYPPPYVAPPETVMLRKERHLTLSAVAGVWLYGLNGVGASTKPGPVWGASGRIDPYRWLGFRLTILRGNQPVTPDYGAFGVPGVQIQQPDYQILHWSIRIEPTWHVTPQFALWAGTGLGWGRAIVPEPSVGDRNWVSKDRACVSVDAQFALGAQYEVVRDWVLLQLDVAGSSLGYQHGSALDAVQAFTPDGHMTHIGGYPNFSHKVQGLFGIGVIL